ncbi:MAG: hypothetical protein ACR2G6_03730, partial [Gemmatimonadaceae bacterium]
MSTQFAEFQRPGGLLSKYAPGSFFTFRTSQLLPLSAMLFAVSALLSQGVSDSPPAVNHSPPYHPGVDVLDYELRVSLPDAGNIIAGVATLTVRRT